MRFKVLTFIAFFLIQSVEILASSKLVYGESQEISQFDPYTVHEAGAQRLADLIFDSLIELNEDGTYSPILAKTFQVSSNNSDVVFTLREDVWWHKFNGSKRRFGIQDVISTVKMLLDPRSEITNRSRFEHIRDAQELSDGRLLLSFKVPVEDPLKYLTFKILPKFAFQEDDRLTPDHKFSRHPIGTGAFVFLKKNSAGVVSLIRNDGYFGEKPALESIEMKPYRDQTIMTQALMYKSLDLLTYISPRRSDEISADRQLEMQSYDSLSYSFIGLNTKKGLLKKKVFRQALSHLADRNEMLAAFFSSKGSLISGPFPPSSWAYNIDVRGYSHDLNEAKKLFLSLGLRYSTEGLLLDHSGAPVRLDFLIPIAGENETNKRIGVAMASYFKQAGISLNLKFLDWQSWKTRVLKEHDFDLTIASWKFDDAANVTSLFHSSESRAWGNNFVQFSSAEVDALLSESHGTEHFGKKTAIFHKLHSIIADEAPYIFLWNLNHHAAYKANLIGVKVDPFSFFRYVKKWDWRSESKVL